MEKENNTSSNRLPEKDVLYYYRHFTKAGNNPIQATVLVIREYLKVLDDIADNGVFWVSLAAVQLEMGEVVEAVREKALTFIKLKDLKQKLLSTKVFETKKPQVELKIKEISEGTFQIKNTKIRHGNKTVNVLLTSVVILVLVFISAGSIYNFIMGTDWMILIVPFTGLMSILAILISMPKQTERIIFDTVNKKLIIDFQNKKMFINSEDVQGWFLSTYSSRAYNTPDKSEDNIIVFIAKLKDYGLYEYDLREGYASEETLKIFESTLNKPPVYTDLDRLEKQKN